MFITIKNILFIENAYIGGKTMKKLGRAIFLAVLVLILAIVILTACNNKGHGQTNDNTQDKKPVVVFIVDDVEYSRVETKGNEIIVMPTNPQKDGYTFVGWFWDKDTWQRPFTANSMLTEPLKSDMSVYAYFERAHEHTYSQKWSHDKTYHWHASTCGHDVVSGKGKHTFDSNWVCTECAYVDTGLHGVELRTNTLELDGTNIFGKVSNATSTFSFINEISIADSAKYTVSTDINGVKVIPTRTVSLSIGDNTFYILVENGKDLGLYTVVIRRRPMYSVLFNVNCGTSVSSQTIEEDYFATEPTTERKGYTFDKWDYDFSQPIIKNTIITASWNIITYNVYYDLNVPSDSISQDVDNSMNVTTYTVEDAIAFKTPSRKGYRFTCWDKNIEKGTIGNVTVTASWEAIEYDIIYDFGDTDSVSKAKNSDKNKMTYCIEDSFVFKSPTRNGYKFLSWNIDEVKAGMYGIINVKASWTVIEKNITYLLPEGQNSEKNLCKYTIENGVFKLEDAINGNKLFSGWYTDANHVNSIDCIDSSMLCDYVLYGIFDSVGTTGFVIDKGVIIDYNGDYSSITTPKYYHGYSVYKIDCISNTSISELVIGNNITQISDGALRECTSLKKITLPFIGESKTANDRYNQVFGYIFGYEKYDDYNDHEGIKQCVIQNLKYYYYIPNSLTNVVISEGIEEIPTSAFWNCSNLVDIVLPKSIMIINKSAFARCESIKEFCIPNGVEKIEGSAFSNCVNLEKINIPNTVKSIGVYAFNNCKSLNEVSIDDLACWCSIEFSTQDSNPVYFSHSLRISKETICDIVVPESVTILKQFTFSGFSNLHSVQLHNGVKEILNGCFLECSGLKSIEIPYSVENINYAFYDSGIESVIISNSEILTKGSFINCNSLRSVTFLDSKGALDSEIFSSNYKKLDIHIMDLKQWCERPVSDKIWIYTYDLYLGDEKIVNLVVPEGVTSIADRAFANCLSIQSVSFPNTLLSIGDSAFEKCYNIGWGNYLQLQRNIQTIGKRAFYGCGEIVAVLLSENLKSIEDDAFKNCFKLIEVCNKSKLTLECGDSSNGCISLYAKYICNNILDSKLSFDGDYVLYKDNMDISLIAYVGISKIITIPGYITSIYNYCFNKNSLFDSLIIDRVIEKIGDYAFYNKIDNIFYLGDEEQWNSIEIEKQKNNVIMKSQIYFYSESKKEQDSSSEIKYWHFDSDGKTPIIWE